MKLRSGSVVAVMVAALAMALAAPPAFAAVDGVPPPRDKDAALVAAHRMEDITDPDREGDSEARMGRAENLCEFDSPGRSETCIVDRSSHNSAEPSVSTFGVVPQGEVVATPSWCAFNSFYFVRTAKCRKYDTLLTVEKLVNGVRTSTGSARFIITSHIYSSTSMPYFEHQVSIAVSNVQGDAAKTLIAGAAGREAPGLDCTGDPDNFFNNQPIVDGQTIVVRATHNSMATAPGAIGRCVPNWLLQFNSSDPTIIPTSLNLSVRDGFRCDNATAGTNNTAGCVVSEYASLVQFSQSATPDLARHVSLAQGSGLPGISFSFPLHRTTDAGIQNTNYTLACGSGTSAAFPGYSCDEYPFKTTYEGLSDPDSYAAGKRSHDGCRYDGNFFVPRGTGPFGVSICRIPGAQQSSQGGTLTQFYRAQRVLDNDPIRVGVKP